MQQHSSPPSRRRRGRGARAGQSVVEYALTIVMIFVLAQGTGRAVYRTFVGIATSLRSALNIADDPTRTPGPAPTLRVPPAPPTLTALPATATVIAMCEVPNLRDMHYNAAAAEWLNYGFRSGTLTKPSGASSIFLIGSQSLVAGNNTPCNTATMHVTPKLCQVPNLDGIVFSTARDGAWTSRGFVAANLLRPAGSNENFTIGSQAYGSGTSIDCMETMNVGPRLCAVPNLSGLVFNINGAGTANDRWDNNFIRTRLTKEAGMPDVFTVAAQSLGAGTSVDCEASMSVRPSLCTVPNLVGAQYLGAQTTWTNSGFATTLQKAANTPSNFVIASQNLSAGQQLACAGSSMSVQPNMCTVPNMVGQSYSTAADNWKRSPNNFTSDLRRPSTVTGDFIIAQQLTPAGTVMACSQEAFVQPDMCTVPNLMNKSYTQASSAWTGAKFTGALQNPFGLSGNTKIENQQYSAGESRACAEPMYVKPRVCTVPDLVGQMYNDVKDSGEAFKNACGGSATLNNDWGGGNRRIGGTTPPAGSEIVYDGTATATEQMCVVPNLVGMTFANAGTRWTTDQFTTALARGSGAPASGSFTVATQSLAAGSSQRCSTAMTVDATLFIRIVAPADGAQGDDDKTSEAPKLEAEAYNPAVASGARGIDRVVFELTSPGGTTYTITKSAAGSTQYCAFGGSCNAWTATGSLPAWSNSLANGYWTLKATAYPVNTALGTVTAQITFRVTD